MFIVLKENYSNPTNILLILEVIASPAALVSIGNWIVLCRISKFWSADTGLQFVKYVSMLSAASQRFNDVHTTEYCQRRRQTERYNRTRVSRLCQFVSRNQSTLNWFVQLLFSTENHEVHGSIIITPFSY